MDNNINSIVKSPNEFQEMVADELLRSKSQFKELSITIDQSQVEVNRLTQKKAAVTAQLQKFQSNLTAASKEEIRDTYVEAMDAQQRLLLMRSQMDKFQEQQSSLEKIIMLLEKVQEGITNNAFSSSSGGVHQAGAINLEMLINEQEAERQRLSRQMHDGPAQALSNFIVQAEIATKYFDIDPSKAKEELDKLKNSAMNTFQKIRGYIADLRPMSLDDLGLVPTIKKYVASVKDETGREISLNITGSEKKLEPYLEVYIFRALQEFVGNSIKHNQEQLSKVAVEVELTIEPIFATLLVRDNGQGFDPAEIEQGHGLGLKVIQERAELLGGKLNIRSDAQSGSEIILKIPVEESTG